MGVVLESDLGEAVVFLARHPQAVRLLRVIVEYRRASGRDPHTRELLGRVRDRGYSMQLLRVMESMGLVRRYEDYLSPDLRLPVVRNGVTELGLRALKLLGVEVDA